jgi:hypothetical protein
MKGPGSAVSVNCASPEVMMMVSSESGTFGVLVVPDSSVQLLGLLAEPVPPFQL